MFGMAGNLLRGNGVRKRQKLRAGCPLLSFRPSKRSLCNQLGKLKSPYLSYAGFGELLAHNGEFYYPFGGRRLAIIRAYDLLAEVLLR